MALAEGWPDDAVEVGRVADAWGVKGWIKIQPFSNRPEALLAAAQWFLLPAEAVVGLKPPGRPAVNLPPCLHVASARRHGDFVVATAQEVTDRGSAEALRGARVFVSRACFPKADADEYYWIDLIGLEVRNRQGQRLGEVAGLIETGPQTVLRIVDAQAAAPVERLVPFVGAYVDYVDLPQRRITVDWGLDY